MTSLVLIIGIIKLIGIAYEITGFVYRRLISKPYDLAERYGKGTWVIHTGSGDGIGSKMCKELAKQGFNLFMISRTGSKLKNVEAQINKECPNIKTKTMVANFQTEQSIAFYRNIFDQVKDLDISLVIVNAGEMYCGLLEEKGQKFKY